MTSSSTRPLLGDNCVLCAIFNFPILVPLIFYLPIPTLINMHIRVGFDPQLDTSYLMTTVLSCNSSFLSLKLIAESKRAGIDHQLDASWRPRVFFSTYLFSLAQFKMLFGSPHCSHDFLNCLTLELWSPHVVLILILPHAQVTLIFSDLLNVIKLKL